MLMTNRPRTPRRYDSRSKGLRRTTTGRAATMASATAGLRPEYTLKPTPGARWCCIPGVPRNAPPLPVMTAQSSPAVRPRRRIGPAVPGARRSKSTVEHPGRRAVMPHADCEPVARRMQRERRHRSDLHRLRANVPLDILSSAALRSDELGVVDRRVDHILAVEAHEVRRRLLVGIVFFWVVRGHAAGRPQVFADAALHPRADGEAKRPVPAGQQLRRRRAAQQRRQAARGRWMRAGSDVPSPPSTAGGGSLGRDASTPRSRRSQARSRSRRCRGGIRRRRPAGRSSLPRAARRRWAR